MALGKKNPFEEIEQLFDRMSRQFEQSTEGMETGMLGMRGMSVDVEDHDDEFVVTADLPGFEKEDIDVRLSDDVLQIDAEHASSVEETSEGMDDDDGGTYIRQERRHRSMSRSVRLPGTVDEEEVEATYRNGVLTITLPKRDAGAESRSIDIR